MSIQIAGGSHPAARAEVVERIRAVTRSVATVAGSDDLEGDRLGAAVHEMEDSVRSLFFSLIGSHPTAEELATLLGKSE